MAIAINALKEVFPSVQYAQAANTEVALTSRAIGEIGIVNIIKRICSNESFVLSFDGTVIEFVLNGYYFKIDTDNLSIDTTVGDVYAHLVMDAATIDQPFPELDGDINNNNFSGLTIDNTQGNDGFLILSKGIVPADSFKKFTSKDISFDGDYIIDCGEIT